MPRFQDSQRMSHLSKDLPHRSCPQRSVWHQRIPLQIAGSKSCPNPVHDIQPISPWLAQHSGSGPVRKCVQDILRLPYRIAQSSSCNVAKIYKACTEWASKPVERCQSWFALQWSMWACSGQTSRARSLLGLSCKHTRPIGAISIHPYPAELHSRMRTGSIELLILCKGKTHRWSDEMHLCNVQLQSTIKLWSRIYAATASCQGLFPASCRFACLNQ